MILKAIGFIIIVACVYFLIVNKILTLDYIFGFISGFFIATILIYNNLYKNKNENN